MKSKAELLKGCEHDGSYIPVKEVERLMDEYATEVRKEMMEFAEWIKNDVDSMYYEGETQWKIYLSATRHIWVKTTEELFTYWLTNIKGK